MFVLFIEILSVVVLFWGVIFVSSGEWLQTLLGLLFLFLGLKSFVVFNIARVYEMRDMKVLREYLKGESNE